MAALALRAATATVLALLASAGPAQSPADDAVAEFLRNEFGLADYRRADVDLDGDDAAESLIYATGPRVCGSGGCNLYILARNGGRLRVVTNASVARLPVTLLPTRSNGWRDIGVTVAGGGIRHAYMARLRFDGRSYPGNPTAPPAEPLAAPSGEVVLAGPR